MSASAIRVVEVARVPDCLISLGSNLGDRHALLSESARLLAGEPQLNQFRASRLFETPPIGGPAGQGAFLNAVAIFRTDCSALEVLDLLQRIEQRLGRKRAERWDARTIDLDVVLYGDRIGDRARLNVPHPRFAARLFVLVPALDVAADWCDPRSGWSIERLVQHHRNTPPSIALTGLERSLRHRLCERLGRREGIEYRRIPEPASHVSVVGNAPAGWRETVETVPPAPAGTGPWVSNEIDCLVPGDPRSPRVVARLRAADPEQRWPALHDVWPNLWHWPEYVVEYESLAQAESEIYSTLQSLSCPVSAVTNDGQWWR